MTLPFDALSFVQKLAAINNRQLKNEIKAARLISTVLDNFRVAYVKQFFVTRVPRFLKADLYADQKRIPCIATCMVGGEINNNDALVSSLISSQKLIKDANINFSPRCRAISRGNHYFAPSIAIHRNDVQKVSKAKRVRAAVRVQPVRYQSQNILVGNLTNPKNIIFCHYDSLGPGAVDNASGTALLLQLAIAYPRTLAATLYVIAGNEELSYDFPIYWGHGYRVFEKKYRRLLTKARRIFIVDSVGNAPTQIFTDPSIVRLGFPVKNQMRWAHKTCMLSAETDALMKVYHSDADTADGVKRKYLNETIERLLQLMRTT